MSFGGADNGDRDAMKPKQIEKLPNARKHADRVAKHILGQLAADPHARSDQRIGFVFTFRRNHLGKDGRTDADEFFFEGHGRLGQPNRVKDRLQKPEIGRNGVNEGSIQVEHHALNNAGLKRHEATPVKGGVSGFAAPLGTDEKAP
ncbi:hypothetical protein DESC_120117 [Desulfosarcina cetonica]|nr:hypothetical protein DESC_120117 [Desulfosarcina cetonica]